MYFECIFLKKKILIQISLKILPKFSIDDESELVQVMAQCQIGDKPLP